MILERTLHMLQTYTENDERAGELGRMGFMQWLGGLRADASFMAEGARALRMAQDFRASDPAVAVFCALVEEAMQMPPRPLSLALPKTCRRGGARRRRQSI